jgi:hypothetical protein
MFSHYRMCSLTMACVLRQVVQIIEVQGVMIVQNVFSEYRMCSHAVECVLLPSHVCFETGGANQRG